MRDIATQLLAALLVAAVLPGIAAGAVPAPDHANAPDHAGPGQDAPGDAELPDRASEAGENASVPDAIPNASVDANASIPDAIPNASADANGSAPDDAGPPEHAGPGADAGLPDAVADRLPF